MKLASFGSSVTHVHDVGGLQRVGELFDFGAGGMAEMDPGQVGRTGPLPIGLVPLAGIESAGRQIGFLVGDENEGAAIGGVVAHQHGALVGQTCTSSCEMRPRQ